MPKTSSATLRRPTERTTEDTVVSVARMGKIWPLEAHTLRPVSIHR